MAPIIRIRNLRKVYPVGKEKVVALNNISLTIEEGQICCILGTSGSGKSTLLNQLAGLEKPTKGAVVLGKTNISKLSESALAKFRQKNVGFIFQSYNLLTSYTALENVAMPLMFRGMGKRRRNKRAMEILKSVGLAKRMKHKPSQMSGGQQQRVGIARAFVAKPKIVFADEPTGNLDTKTTKEVMELMVNLCRKNNQTLVLVTHDRDLALYADRIITLIDGNIVDDRPNQSIARTEEQIKEEQRAQKEQQEAEERESEEQKRWETEGLEGEEPEDIDAENRTALPQMEQREKTEREPIPNAAESQGEKAEAEDAGTEKQSLHLQEGQRKDFTEAPAPESKESEKKTADREADQSGPEKQDGMDKQDGLDKPALTK